MNIMQNFYISDLHIGHANVIRFDNRPFADLDDMYNKLVENWNSAVKKNDTVYILGDFIWAKEKDWPSILEELKGNKVLIRGNHDPREFSEQTKRYFQDIKDYKEIIDRDRHVILCHYPIPFHKRGYDGNTWMLYGHVHTTKEYEYLKQLRAQMINNWKGSGDSHGNFINVGCMMPWMDYTPRTLDEIIANNQ